MTLQRDSPSPPGYLGGVESNTGFILDKSGLKKSEVRAPEVAGFTPTSSQFVEHVYVVTKFDMVSKTMLHSTQDLQPQVWPI